MRVSSRADTELGQEFPEAEIIRRRIASWQPTDRLPLYWLRVLPDPPLQRNRRLRTVLVVAVVAGALVLTLSTVASSNRMNLWSSMQNAANEAMKQLVPPSPVASPLPSDRPVGNVATPTQAAPDPVRAAVAANQPAPTPSASVSGGHGSGGAAVSGPVNVTVTSAPAASKDQGVSVGAPPQGVMTGSVSEGPIYAGGTIYQDGVAGCVGVYDQTTGTIICGTVTLPIGIPLPSLPAPTVPDATKVTSAP